MKCVRSLKDDDDDQINTSPQKNEDKRRKDGIDDF